MYLKYYVNTIFSVFENILNALVKLISVYFFKHILNVLTNHFILPFLRFMYNICGALRPCLHVTLTVDRDVKSQLPLS